MKEKIIFLIIGLLLGAVITAGCFLILKQNSPQNNNFPNQQMQFRGNKGNFMKDRTNNDGQMTPVDENGKLPEDGNMQPEMPNGEIPNEKLEMPQNGQIPGNTQKSNDKTKIKNITQSQENI